MHNMLTLAALWISLALLATIISYVLGIATALSEIMVGIAAQAILSTWLGLSLLDPKAEWIQFLASTGAVLLTFLAGAELDPMVFKTKWKEASLVGLTSFFTPFFGCAALAYYGLHWTVLASWLAGIVLSTTSVAVVYAVMLEFGLNATDYGKTVLAACFVTDLGTVLALGLMFSPFTIKTIIFFMVSIVICILLPWVTPRIFKLFGNRPSEFEAKFLFVCLFALGALAVWAGSEAVLPAYLIGMALAGTVGKNHNLIHRLRTLTFGLLTPFYFIRAGSFVSMPALAAAPLAFFILFFGKIITKLVGVYPVTRLFGAPKREGIYTTLLMSTGLTFGSISALFGLSHGIINNNQYSYLIAVVIGSAIIPTVIANLFFLPHHLISKPRNISIDEAQGSQAHREIVESD